MTIDRAAAERAISQFLVALGRDSARDPELANTPERVVEAFEELLSGYNVDTEALLASGSVPVSGDQPPGLVVIKDISVVTVCPHHLMPALGSATIAYLPGNRLLGLGTIARLVDAFARRLTLQEQIGASVTQALCEAAGARGAFCQLSLVHGCLSARGSHRERASVTTISRRGDMENPAIDCDLAMALGARPGSEEQS